MSDGTENERFITIMRDDAARRRRMAFEGVRRNADLMLVYHGIMLGIVFLFTIRCWRTRLLRLWARSRRRVQDSSNSTDSGLASSSSSTLSGNTSPPQIDNKGQVNDETRPLLASRRPVSFAKRGLRRYKALAMYQPPNIPLVNKILPSVSSMAVIASFIGINVFFIFYDISFSIDMQIVFSDRTGLLFAANLPWLYLLAAKNQPLRFLTGYSYEGLNIIHRRLGEVMCILPVLHGMSMLVVWWYVLQPIGVTPWLFFTHPRVVLGLVAFACYEALYFTSLASFRQWWYELFLASHVLLQCAGLIILYFHHPGGRKYVLIALAIFLMDRLIFRLGLKSKTIRADLTVMDDGQTVLVSHNWPLRASRARWLGLNIEHGWRPTEHIFLTAPALGASHLLQSHPFTIASAAPSRDATHAWLTLLIRAHDGFTHALLAHAHTHASLTLRVDGPYGSPAASELLLASDLTLLVAGGSGIAVIYPLLWMLLHPGPGHRAPRVALIWILHSAAHRDWLGQPRLDDLRLRGLRLCIPPPTLTAGRPDLPALTRGMLEEMVEIDGGERDAAVGVVVSGPDGVNRSVRNACSALAGEGWDVQVAVEKYGW